MRLTDAQVLEEFGDPAEFMLGDGTVSSLWPRELLDTVPLPAPIPLPWGGVAKYVSCHYRIRDRMRAALEAAFHNPDAWSSINDYAGCYNFRMMRKVHRLSRHSWGIAIDLDSRDNPQGRAPNMHQGVINAFTAQGFAWGGAWKEPLTDGMHFEFADLAKIGARR